MRGRCLICVEDNGEIDIPVVFFFMRRNLRVRIFLMVNLVGIKYLNWNWREILKESVDHLDFLI